MKWFVISGLATPNRVRDGVVTDSSIELLWDPAEGHAHSYEVICLNCDHSQMVNPNNVIMSSSWHYVFSLNDLSATVLANIASRNTK